MVWEDKKMVRYTSTRRRKYKLKLVELKGGKCELCGYKKCIQALEFHHQRDKDKKISLLHNRGWDNILKETQGTLLVCANCHRELHTHLKPGEAVNR